MFRWLAHSFVRSAHSFIHLHVPSTYTNLPILHTIYPFVICLTAWRVSKNTFFYWRNQLIKGEWIDFNGMETRFARKKRTFGSFSHFNQIDFWCYPKKKNRNKSAQIRKHIRLCILCVCIYCIKIFGTQWDCAC